MSTSADHEAIIRQVYRYAYGVDLRDWDDYRTLFDDEFGVAWG